MWALTSQLVTFYFLKRKRNLFNDSETEVGGVSLKERDLKGNCKIIILLDPSIPLYLKKKNTAANSTGQ